MRVLCGTISLALLISCANVTAERSELALGTVCSVRILKAPSKAASADALSAAFERLHEIDESMSASSPDSYISAVNAAAGAHPVAVPPDVLYVIEKAVYYAELSGGLFDPSIGPLSALWSIGREGERVPRSDEIEEALGKINYKNIRIDAKAGTVFLTKTGMRLDLGAIAKGYAADELAAIFERQNIRALIDLGGNIKLVGAKPDGSDWNVGIQNPFAERGGYFGIYRAPANATLVTSGIYERCFTAADGASYHHILDTKNGYPIQNDLVSVTIISASSIDADGLSTALFVLGLKQGLDTAESLHGVEAVFVDKEKRVFMTSGARAAFSISDVRFQLAQDQAE